MGRSSKRGRRFDVENLTSDAIMDLEDEAAPLTDDEKAFLARAWSRAEVREHEARIHALPADARVSLRDAANYLCLTESALLSWIHTGRLTASKEFRGPRSFRWVVSLAVVERLRVAHDARIARERAWMQEPAAKEADAGEVVAADAPEPEAITERDWNSMWGDGRDDDPQEGA